MKVIGLKPDLKKARVVADYLGTVHHEIHYTIQEGLDALRDVIYHIETYDVTTIRASTPMYLMARYIKAMGIKMVLSGEGSDEIFDVSVADYINVIRYDVGQEVSLEYKEGDTTNTVLSVK